MGTVWLGERRRDSAEIDRRIAQAAAGFESLGLKAGDGVALCLRNDFPFYEAGMGAGQLGVYAVAMNWHYTVDEASYLLKDSGAKALVIHADLLAPIREAIPEGVKLLVVPVPPELQAAYGIPPELARVPEGLTDWDAWREGFEPRTAPPEPMPSAIIYTSGTTGRPKGVRRPTPTAERRAAADRVFARSYGFGGGFDDPSTVVTAIVGPIYHSAPNAHANYSYRMGADVVIMPRFDAEELLALIQKHRITHLNMVPIMFNRLLKLPEEVRRRYDLSSLRFVAHAAAPVSPPVKRAMIEWWGPIVNEYYGSTEMSNVTFCTAQEWLDHPGTVGRVVPDAEVRIVDAEGKDLPPRAIGEVIGRVHGVGDFTYHGDPEKRKRVEKRGLISPGDVGYFDEDGFLYLCDRSNDMIISGGVNIYPAQIEAQLHRMPEVADCAVFGIPDDEYGEAVCAVVQAQPGCSPTEADVRAFLRQHVAGYMVPRRVEFMSELPREDSGKIFKRKLRQPYWENAGRSI
ncbi:MAG TPA: acyl-CoA synthetase [Quisquiliibacterium sp.]|nr:acyl-CoA synthetase [Quisquiliibacterium sp.]